MQTIRLVNSYDEEQVRRGFATEAQVHAVEIEAVVSTRATMLVLPADVVSRLGLAQEGYRKVRYSDGRIATLPWVAGIRITVLGREAAVNALVDAAGTTPVIGHVPLTALDLHIDPGSGELRPNPASPSQPLMDALATA
jgi:predicted aspartyl protease